MTGKTDGTDTWTYVWDEDNRLTRVDKNSVTQVEYEYDALARMVRRVKDSDETKFEWDGLDLIKEDDGTQSKRYYTQAMQILTFEVNGSLYQAFSDGLFSVRAITDDSGDVVAAFGSDAWGSALTSSFDNIPGGNPFRFVGSLGVRQDTATALYYMRHRWYDAGVSRFLSPDPLGRTGSGVNLYAYAGGAPNNWVDPTGQRITYRLPARLRNLAQRWMSILTRDGSPLKPLIDFLQADPRNVVITSADLGGDISGYTKPSSYFEFSKFTPQEVVVQIDFDRLLSEEGLSECDNKPAIVLGHELGHAFQFFTQPKHAALLRKSAKQRPDLFRIDGLPIDEIVVFSAVEEPLRSFLGAPPFMQDSTVEAAQQALKNAGFPYNFYGPFQNHPR